MERLLHYVWQHKLYPVGRLETTDGRLVEIINPGLHNDDAGPDFFNTSLKIDGELWAGNVEIHTLSSDWYRHGHDRDHAYDSVILHVVERADRPVATSEGKLVPQLELQVPDYVSRHYEELQREAQFPPCYRGVGQLPRFVVRQWLDALCTERLESKMERINGYVAALSSDWETAFFQTVARSFGFGINGDAFEEWARGISLSAAGKHRDDLFQIEALFLGQAGLLEDDMLHPSHRSEAFSDGYFLKLQAEYRFLAHKFTLTPMNGSHWKFLRLRPQNFPHIRLVQLARLFCKERLSLSTVLDAPDAAAVRDLLDTDVTPYWHTHYTFGALSRPSAKVLSPSSRDIIIINAVVPFIFAYGRHRQRRDYCEKSLSLLNELKAEDNKYTRIWRASGLAVTTAADSQALVQLRTAYCHARDCLRCRFGYEYLKNKLIYRPDDFLREGAEQS